MTASPDQERHIVRITGDSPARVLERLSHVSLLRALPAEEVQGIVPYVQRCRIPTGRRVLTQGEPGDALYFVDEGRLRVEVEGQREVGTIGPGEAFGELALLTGEPRSASVVAETNVEGWRIGLDDFERVIRSSPRLNDALRELAARHRAGLDLERAAQYEARTWLSRALRGLEAQHRGLHGWQLVMAGGFALWVLLFLNSALKVIDPEHAEALFAVLELVAGLAIIQGACEAFVQGVERLGARLRWEGFISGTVAETVSTFPEFVVIAFLVQVEPLAAFVTAVVTIYNNAIAFSIYSFFLPKDKQGTFLMPPSLTKAGGEVLVAGSGIALIVGTVMLVLRAETHKTSLAGLDLFVLGAVFFVVFAYYAYTLIHYYGSMGAEHEAHAPHPHELGHDTSWSGIGQMFTLGVAGAFFGGESIGAFADTALHSLGFPTIPTAAGLALFAGISEYVIVYKAHRRGELGIALASVFGGMTQVMFLLVPFSMVVIAVFGLVTGQALYTIPITTGTTMLMLLLFPLFYVLLQYIEEDHTLSNLDAAAMTGIYGLLLYFLFTAPGPE